MSGSRFLLVTQRCFGSASGMRVEELENVINADHAEDIAKIKTHSGFSGGYEMSYRVIEIADTETTKLKPRKLTWKERLTGRIKPEDNVGEPAVEDVVAHTASD